MHRGSVLTSKSNSSSALLRSLPHLPAPEAQVCLSLECWCSPLLACSPSTLPQLQRRRHWHEGCTDMGNGAAKSANKRPATGHAAVFWSWLLYKSEVHVHSSCVCSNCVCRVAPILSNTLM